MWSIKFTVLNLPYFLPDVPAVIAGFFIFHVEGFILHIPVVYAKDTATDSAIIKKKK